MKSTKLESKIQKEVLKYLNDNKIWHFRYQAQANKNGLPDIMALYKGVFMGIELKKDDGVPTTLQLKKLKGIETSGGLGLLIRDVNELKDIIKEIDGNFKL